MSETNSVNVVLQRVEGHWILTRQRDQTSVGLIFYGMKGEISQVLKHDCDHLQTEVDPASTMANSVLNFDVKIPPKFLRYKIVE